MVNGKRMGILNWASISWILRDDSMAKHHVDFGVDVGVVFVDHCDLGDDVDVDVRVDFDTDFYVDLVKQCNTWVSCTLYVQYVFDPLNSP